MSVSRVVAKCRIKFLVQSWLAMVPSRNSPFDLVTAYEETLVRCYPVQVISGILIVPGTGDERDEMGLIYSTLCKSRWQSPRHLCTANTIYTGRVAWYGPSDTGLSNLPENKESAIGLDVPLEWCAQTTPHCCQFSTWGCYWQGSWCTTMRERPPGVEAWVGWGCASRHAPPI
jgi:hypothetical protein